MENFYNWFVGFVDGEGCFSCTLNNGSLNFRFKISLRADDKDILEEIRNKLGFGKVVYEPYYRRNIVLKGKPQYKFVLYSKKDREKLIEILDTYPLRSKKKKDYEVWKMLHNGLEEKILLVNRLKEVRQYSLN